MAATRGSHTTASNVWTWSLTLDEWEESSFTGETTSRRRKEGRLAGEWAKKGKDKTCWSPLTLPSCFSISLATVATTTEEEEEKSLVKEGDGECGVLSGKEHETPSKDDSFNWKFLIFSCTSRENEISSASTTYIVRGALESDTPTTNLPSVSCNHSDGFEPYREIKEAELISENGGGGGREWGTWWDEVADDNGLLNTVSETRGEGGGEQEDSNDWRESNISQNSLT